MCKRACVPSFQWGRVQAPECASTTGAGKRSVLRPAACSQIREVRLEAQAQVDTVDEAELLTLNLKPAPERQLVVYDDI